MLREHMCPRLCNAGLALIAILMSGVSCRKSEVKPVPTGSSASAPAAESTAASSVASGRAPQGLVEDDPSIKPVYPPLVGEPDPRAKRYCRALLELPAERKARCCGTTAGFTATGECLRTLTHALRSGAITIEPGALDRCVVAAEKSLEGCDWVGPAPPAPPEACADIFRGTRTTGTVCISSLECSAGLFCRGLGAAQRGVCAPPAPADAPCGSGIDGLVAYTRPPNWQKSHPECTGYCLGRRCQAPVLAGGACNANAECNRGLICTQKSCRAGSLPDRGQACASGECMAGLRCHRGRCETPLAAGEKCESDDECVGGCVAVDAGPKSRCGMKCSDPRALERLFEGAKKKR